MHAADVIVIPTRCTSRDIETLERMRTMVRSYSADVIYVLNGWNRFTASRDFLEWFSGQASDLRIKTLPQSEAFVKASAAEKSVVEFDRNSKAAMATLEMVNVIRKTAGFPAE